MAKGEVVRIQQTVIPQKVYVGDTVTIQCTFNSASQDLKTNGISTKNFVEIEDQDFLEIQKAELRERGVDFYDIIITAVPWQTGELSIPDMEFENGNYIIKFNSFYVSSVLSGKENTKLRSIQTPQLLAGTTYALYGVSVVSIILIVILLNLIIRHKKFMNWIKFKKKEFLLKRNKKQTLKAIAVLQNSKTQTQKESAKLIQDIARKYMEVRLEKSYTKFTTLQIKKELQNVPENIKKAVINLFTETDEVRYGREKLSSLIESENNLEKTKEITNKNNALWCKKFLDIVNDIENYFYEELKKSLERSEVQNV